LNLLQSLSREPDFVIRRLLRFLDEGVKHDYTPPDKEAVKSSANARPAPGPQLEQAIAKCSRIRQIQVWAMLDQQFHDSRVIGKDIYRP